MVEAHSVETMKLLWSKRYFLYWYGQPEYNIFQPPGITTDGRGLLFISDTIKECIQIFDTDGKYLCPVDCNGKLELGIPERLDWSKTESALVVTHRLFEKCFISVLNYKLILIEDNISVKKESDKLQIKGQGILILIYEQKAQVKG